MTFPFHAKNNPRNISHGSRKASENAVSILSQKSEKYEVEVTSSGDYIFFPSERNPEYGNAGFIFYPGGKVEAEAYLPVLKGLAEKGCLSVLVHMPGDLAVLDPDGAKKIIRRFSDVDHWFIGGHSLGGAMAASYASKKEDVFDGIILFAAYSTKKISDGISVLSIFGSCDGVLSKEKYEKNRCHFPKDFTEIVIDGGCHSFFGDYGMQDGDGEPTVSREEQMEMVISAVDEFIRNVESKKGR